MSFPLVGSASAVSAYVHRFGSRLWILSLGWLVSAIGFAVSLPFVAIYLEDKFALSYVTVGAIFALMAGIRSIFQIVFGEISDRVGRKSLLVWSQVLRGMSMLGMALAIYGDWGLGLLVTFLMINSLFGAVFHPVANALVSDILPPDLRLDGYAITRSAGNLGWAIGPAVGGFLAEYSYGLLFVISAVAMVASGVVFGLFFRAPDEIRSSDRFGIRDFAAVVNDKLLGLHCLLTLMLFLIVGQLMVPMSLYVVDNGFLDKDHLGMLYTINGLMVVLFQIPITRALSRYRVTTQLVIGSLLYACGWSLMGFGQTLGFFAVVIVIVTLGELVTSPPTVTLTSRLAPPGRTGRYMGIYGFFWSSGWTFGPIYGTFFLDALSPSPILAWMSIASLGWLAALGYALMARRLPADLNTQSASHATPAT